MLLDEALDINNVFIPLGTSGSGPSRPKPHTSDIVLIRRLDMLVYVS